MQLNRITKHDSSIAMGEQGRMHACTVYSNVREIGEGISAVMLWIVYAMRMIILQYGYGMEYGGTDIAMARITSSSHGNQVQDLRSMLVVANFPEQKHNHNQPSQPQPQILRMETETETFGIETETLRGDSIGKAHH